MVPTLTFLALLLAVLIGPAPRNLPVDLLEESVVRLEGGSTIKDWTCTTSDLRAWARPGGPEGLAGGLQLPVATLECGDDRMEADLREAVREPEHPAIAFDLTRWEIAPEGEGFRGVAHGGLTLAGVTRDVEVVVRGEPSAHGGVRVEGRTELLMTSFGIQPPSAFFGLIKARDRVAVRFDVRADAATVEWLRALHAGPARIATVEGGAGALPR